MFSGPVLALLVMAALGGYLLGSWRPSRQSLRLPDIPVNVPTPPCKRPRMPENEQIGGPCRLPPPGWECSRPRGHEGPCAASTWDKEVSSREATAARLAVINNSIHEVKDRIETMEDRIMQDLSRLKATVSKLATDQQENFDAVKALVQKALETPVDDTAAINEINDQLDTLSAGVEAATKAALDAVNPPTEQPAANETSPAVEPPPVVAEPTDGT